MSLAHIGKTFSEETKAKMSAARKGNKNAVGSKRSQEHIKAMAAGRRAAKYNVGTNILETPIYNDKISE